MPLSRNIDAALNRTSNLDQALDWLNLPTTRDQISGAQGMQQAKGALGPDLKEAEAVKLRAAKNKRDLDQIYRLVHDAYVERGYIEPRDDGRLVLYPRLDNIPETTVIIMWDGDLIVGTNSLTIDGPRGLPSDEDFKKECKSIRAEGRRLAGSWRLCTRTGYRDERHIVLELIARTVRLTLQNDIETCVFTINPRHVDVYRRLLNMTLVSQREDTVKGLQNAPAVLMRCDRETLPKWCFE